MKIAEYGIGNWKVDGRGNHRAVVRVSESCPVVLAELCWRRHDENPETKDIMVENEKGERVSRKVISVTKEKGLVAFEAQTEGLYYIYYLPFVQPREFFVPKTPYFRAGSLDYTKPIKALGDNPILKEEEKFDTESFPVLSELGYNENIDYPKAELVRIEARGEFNSMYPMEVPATDEEYNSLTEGRKDFMVFAEDRINQIRMKDAVPYKWYESGEVLSLEGEARPNEIWTFQIGVLALSDIKNLRLEFSDFGGLSASDFHCINMGGKDWLGREFKKEINVKKDRVQAMWVYVDIPKNAEKEYKGTVYVKADNCETREAKLNISVRGEVLDDKGFSDLWRMSRLAWLDSDMAIDDTVVPPYIPIEVSDNKAKILNREIIFSDTGFPLSIKSYGREILSESVSFRVGEESVEKISEKVLKKNEGVFEKEYISGNDNIELRVCPKLEFEGCLNYGVTLRAKKDMSFEDVSLCVPVKKDIAEYFMGMAVRGGLAPDYAEWKWQSDNAAHMAWCGTYNAGIQLRLETKNHGYFITPPIPREEYPHGWYNNGAELFSAKKEENVFLMKAQRGKTEMKAGEELSFDVRFMITPFKPLDNKHHYRDRVGLPGQPRTNIVHIHHATGAVNPYINYPFRTVEKLKEVQNGLKAVPNDKRAGEYMKRLDPSFEGSLIGRYPIKDEWFTNEGTTDYNINIYYTCRELSNHCYEIFALRSLGDEIYSDSGIIYDAQGGTVLKDGSGGGHPWVAEHLKDDYVPGWYCWLGEDHCQAVCTRFVSRWMNYYVCGMDFLMKKTGIDGLYLDGIGYDRETSKRIARVMAKNSKNYRINYHSGNNYDYENWKSNVCSNTIEHLPFMTTLWIGEMFDYDRSSDYWFAEISGIPFGLYSEMLNYETGGNRYRGMLFSMTGRQNPSYIPMLKFWDDYNLEEWEMRGWWEENPPVKAVGSDKVLATAYLPPDKNEMIIAVASWAEKREKISLKITEEALTDCPLTAFMPPIDEFQAEKSNVDLNNIEIRPGEGVIIIVKGDKENA